jgi:hypothetical protein
MIKVIPSFFVVETQRLKAKKGMNRNKLLADYAKGF